MIKIHLLLGWLQTVVDVVEYLLTPPPPGSGQDLPELTDTNCDGIVFNACVDCVV